MSLPRLCSRITRLEALRPAVADPPDIPREFSDEKLAAFLVVFYAQGKFASVEEMSRQCLGLTDTEIAALHHAMEETPRAKRAMMI